MVSFGLTCKCNPTMSLRNWENWCNLTGNDCVSFHAALFVLLLNTPRDFMWITCIKFCELFCRMFNETSSEMWDKLSGHTRALSLTPFIENPFSTAWCVQKCFQLQNFSSFGLSFLLLAITQKNNISLQWFYTLGGKNCVVSEENKKAAVM